MSLSDAELSILRAIDRTGVVSPVEGTWAVKEGFAVQAEDGDIDLTPAGREVLNQSEE